MTIQSFFTLTGKMITSFFRRDAEAVRTSFEIVVKIFSDGWVKAYDALIHLVRKHYRILQVCVTGKKRRREQVQKEVEEISSLLRSAMGEVESAFLDIGHMLQDIHQDAARLTDMVSKTDASGTGNEGTMDITRVETFFRQASSGLAGCGETILKRLDILDQGINYLEILYRSCESTEKISLLLNVISLNMAVESNRSVAAKQMFEVFVKEVEGLSDKMGGIARQLHDDARLACTNQQRYREDMADHFDRLSAFSDDAQRVANAAVTEAKDIVTRASAALEKAHLASQTISAQVREIVIAVQCHDIVRQQLEHVLSGLADMVQFVGDRSPEQDGDGAHKPGDGGIYLSLKIQYAQIEAAIDEINSAYETISKAFEIIDRQVNDLMVYTADSVGGERSFETVICSLTHLNQLIGDAYDLNDSMETIAEDAASKSVALLNYVDEVHHISMDLHRKALNAIIKAAHLGDRGRTFEVLAKEVTATANESAAFADQVEKMVSAVTDQANRLKKGGGEADRHSGLDRETFVRSLEVGTRDISTMFRLWRDNSQAASTMAKTLAQSIGLARDTLSFITLFREKLEESLAGCEGMLDRYTPDVHMGDGIWAGVDGTKARYTMENERILHERIMTGTKGSPLPDAAPPDNADDNKDGDKAPMQDDDLGDNVELF